MKIEIPNMTFESFQKITRANKAFGCVITEKLDGTNGQIVIADGKIVAVGSRSRWIAPGKHTDNYGFAAWVESNYEELLKLGEGSHFGEWYGSGIQRNYGLSEKRFALFNAGRWEAAEDRPSCCECVPVLHVGDFSREILADVMSRLSSGGSVAAPGFMKPEGVIIYLSRPRVLLKETFDSPQGKWADAA